MASDLILAQFNSRYRVTFYEREETSSRLTAWLGDSPPTPSAGGGGWNVINLPMRSSVTVWQGRTGLLLLDVPIMLWNDDMEPVTHNVGNDPRQRGFATQEPTSTAGQVRRLMRMWRPADASEPPPVIRVSSRGDLVPFSNLPYVVNDVTWGGGIGDDAGNRIVQQMTVQLMEYRADEVLQTTRLQKGAKAKRTRVYVTRSGDTLSSIAKRYHLRGGWRQLARAQTPPINDPRGVRPGTRLIIPAP